MWSQTVFFVFLTLTLSLWLFNFTRIWVLQEISKSNYQTISTLKSQVTRINENLLVVRRMDNNRIFIPDLPIIYVITPTYARPTQKAELTRLFQTFMHVPNLHWILVEDSIHKSQLVKRVLQKSGLSFTHLNVLSPKQKKRTKRGINQRNAALIWLRKNLSPDAEGVLYFADDDNTYSLEIFEEMRWVEVVGVWPVGLVGGAKVERPNVRDGEVVGWLAAWIPQRPFAIDMAGFAINVKRFLSRPDGTFRFESQSGFLEGEFLKYFVDSLSELEPKADNCTKVYVWHTRTETPNLIAEEKLLKAGKNGTDFEIEV